MSLNSRTIAKILREHFTGETPIIKNASEHKEFISSLKPELKKIKGVNVSSYYRSSWDNDPDQVCHFSVNDESSRYGFDYDSFTIKFNQENELIIEHYGDSAIVYQIEQIYSFIERLKLEYEKRKARRLKKEKINKLKQQAIIAKMKEIAKEDKFDFHTREYDRKLKLTVRIEGGKLLEIDIPYKEFQDTLKELRSLIQTIRGLQNSGITFRIKSDSKYGGYGWITHDSL